MGKQIVAGVLTAAILGFFGWLAGGTLISALGGVTKNEFERRLIGIEDALDPQEEDSIWKALDSLKPTNPGDELSVSFETDDEGERYAVLSGKQAKMTLRESEIMLKSAFITAETDLSKWVKMADGSLLYPVEVNFDKPIFGDKPSVIVGVTGFQYSPKAINQAVRVEAMNPLPDGFKLHFSFRPGGYVTQIHAHWLAYGPR